MKYVVRKVDRPAWSRLIPISNLFDVVLADYQALCPGPVETVARFAYSGAPPLIALVGDIAETERIDLLQAGAAYCLSEVAGPAELSARIDALAVRRTRPSPHALLIGEWILDLSGKRLITPQLDMTSLTPVEFGLLELFVCSGGRVLSRAFLLGRLGKLHEVFTERAIDVHISRLRRKLQDWGAGEIVHVAAARNEGYVCRTSVRPLPFHRPRAAQPPFPEEVEA